MHPDIEQDAAALRRVGPPRHAFARRRRAFHRNRARGADGAGSQDLRHPLQATLKSQMQADAQLHSGGAAGRHHRATILDCQRERLFAQDVLAGASRGEHNYRMKRIRRADKNRVHILVVHKFFEGVVGSGYCEALGKGTGRGNVATCAGHDLRGCRALDGRRDFLGDVSAETHETPAQCRAG